LKDLKEILVLMDKMENLGHLDQMDHQETEDLQDYPVPMDPQEQEVCRAHRVREEMEANLGKKARQEYLDCKVHLVHLDKGVNEEKMVLLVKKVLLG